MNESILKLFEQIREASLATKVTFASLLLGAVAVAGGALLWSNRPHYVTLHQGLTDTQFAAVGSSLAEAGIAFKHSAPPGPITVYVDESRLPAAQAAMFLSNALTTSDGGILTDNSVFKSAGEREQAKRKREWQEMEQMLTTLDFVRGASVKTFHEEVRAFGSESEITGSVSLTLVPGHNLTQDKARTVAKMVRFGLGVSEEKLIVTQQDGSAAYDGEDLLAGEGGDWNEQVDREDRRLEDKANELLAAVLGPGRARVSVRTEWDQTQATTVAAIADPKQRAAVYEESNTQKTPQFAPAPVGGYAGSSGNLIDPAVQESTGGGAIDARTGLPQPTQEPQVASITDTRTEYEPSKTVTQTVRRTPRLERMSVSMFLDTSLAEQEQALVRAVKATVGFVETRDSFESAMTTFYTEAVEPALDENGQPIEAPVEAPTETTPNPMIELFLTRGVEIVSALAFVILLFVSLRSSKRNAPGEAVEAAGTSGAKGPSGKAAAVADEEIDPELLAIHQVEQLLESDPERVGRILSSWAREHGMARL